MAGTLFVIATPIGNLGDITLRALEVLKSVDFILCEDTRVTQKLLSHYEVKTSTLRYNEREEAGIKHILDLFNQGKNLALVSDAGTPAISDPGGKLISAAIQQCHNATITSIPGPSALTAAASIAGFPMDRFVFLGFPPVKKRRKKFFEEAANFKYPVILYESPHRILRTLNDLAVVVPARSVVVCRELTKKFETMYRGTVAEILEKLHNEEIRGEFVIIISA